MLFKRIGKSMGWTQLVKPSLRNYSTSSLTVPKTLSVIGSGQMGVGIAYCGLKLAKIPSVYLYDHSPHSLNKGHQFLIQLLEKDVKKEKISLLQKEEILSRLTVTENLEELEHSEFVVEAVVEDLQVKRQLFNQLDQLVNKEAILATNTSSIPITKIAASTKRAEKVIGMHFMNPVPIMKLVEVINGLTTSKHTLDVTLHLAKAMGKLTTTSQDTPGFIANRLLMPFINEAVFALMEGVASKEDIDLTMRLGTNHPMGPLTLADFIGLDTCLSIMEVLHSQLGDSKYRPAPLLRTYVDAGFLGKKSGRGFYTY